MQGIEFVGELAKIAPSEGDLLASGIAAPDVHKLRRRYMAARRSVPITVPSKSDEILDLMRAWDLGAVEVGMVRFAATPTNDDDIIVGTVEVDPLVLRRDTGEIAVLELGVKQHTLWHVAKNGARLLDALIVAARFFRRRGDGEIAFDDYDAARLVAKECASLAGGLRYDKFFRMLLRSEE